MYTDDQIAVLATVQKTVKQYGVKILADRLRVTPQTLYSDVDPKSIGRRTNKLGLLDWLIIMDETQNFSSLDSANKRVKRISLPVPEPSAEMAHMTWMEFCATIAKESGEAVAELADAILDGKMDAQEMERCEKETWEALEAFAGLYMTIKNSNFKKGAEK